LEKWKTGFPGIPSSGALVEKGSPSPKMPKGILRVLKSILRATVTPPPQRTSRSVRGALRGFLRATRIPYNASRQGERDPPHIRRCLRGLRSAPGGVGSSGLSSGTLPLLGVPGPATGFHVGCFDHRKRGAQPVREVMVVGVLYHPHLPQQILRSPHQSSCILEILGRFLEDVDLAGHPPMLRRGRGGSHTQNRYTRPNRSP
jgi:hypothetical protein